MNTTLVLLGCLVASQPRALAVEGEKSEQTALACSVVGTALPLVVAGSGNWDDTGGYWLVLGAVVVGPSLGHFYAENPGRAALGIAVRGLAAFAFTAGLIAAYEGGSGGEDAAGALVVGGLLVGGGLALADIATAPASARAYNERLRRSGLSWGPTVTRSGAPGLAVSATF